MQISLFWCCNYFVVMVKYNIKNIEIIIIISMYKEVKDETFN